MALMTDAVLAGKTRYWSRGKDRVLPMRSERPKAGTAEGDDRERAELDFFWFCTDILGLDRRRLLGEDAQPDDVDLWPPLHGDLCRYLQSVEASREPYHCVMLPREHFKSTIASVAYPIWRLVKNSDTRILIVHGRIGHAEKFLREIKWHFEYTERLRAMAPDVIWDDPRRDSPVWLTQEIVLKRNQNDKVPSLSVTSIDSGFAGLHYHLILLDDIVHEGNYATETTRQGTREARDHADHLLRRHGKIVNVGTRWHFADAHGDLVDGAGFKGSAPTGRFTGQVRLMHRSVYDEQGEPIFPTHWTKERLIDKQGRTLKKEWQAQFLNDPNPADDAKFLESDFRWFQLQADGTVPTGLNLNFWTAVDPNRSEKTQHDPCVVMTAARDSDGHIWVVDVTRGHPSGPEIVDWIRGHVQRWSPESVIVETNNFQLQLCQWLREDMLRHEMAYNIYEAMRGPTSKKYDRISAMEPMVRANALHIREGLDVVALELKNWPAAKHDDCCDALADIWRYGTNPEPKVERKVVAKSPYLMKTLLEQTKARSLGSSRVARRA
jgi:phage terminase large subunit-like protein